MNDRPVNFITVLLSVLLVCSFCGSAQARHFHMDSSDGSIDVDLNGIGMESGSLNSVGCSAGGSCQYFLHDGPSFPQLLNYQVTVTPAQPVQNAAIQVKYCVWSAAEQCIQDQDHDVMGTVNDGQFYFYLYDPVINQTDSSLSITSGTMSLYIFFVYTYNDSISFHPNLLGGQHHNINTTFLHDSAKPGPPSPTQPKTPGSGPGVKSTFGLPRYWINSATLNLVIEDSNFSYKGLGPDVSMTRTYNADPSSGGMFGNGWHFAYESKVLMIKGGAPIFLIKGPGQISKYVPDLSSSGFIEDPPDGKDDRLNYFSSGDYWIWETKKNHWRYRYDHEGCASSNPGFQEWHLTSITDANGNALVVTLDPATCAISSITDAAGRTTSFTYDNDPDTRHCLSMTVPNGLTAHYAYSGGNLTGTTDLMGTATSYSYDTDNYLKSMSVEGKTTNFTYSGSGTTKMISGVVDALGHSRQFQKDSTTGVVTSFDSFGLQSTYGASDGKTTGTTDSLSNTTGRSYSDSAHMLSFTDSNSKTTSLGYDARGNLAHLITPTSETYSTPHDGSDNLIGITDPLNNATSITYDGNHNPTSVTSPKLEKTTMAYDGAGQLNKVTDANYHTTVAGYDSFGNRTSITDPLGNTASRAFDAHGFTKTSETDALGNTTHFTYDNNQRLLQTTYADGNFTSNIYDCCALNAFTDENGHTTTFTRNALLYTTEKTDALGSTTFFDYDANNNVTKVTDANGLFFTTTYDGINRPSVTTDPLGYRISRQYDPNWNVTSITDQLGRKTLFTYDSDNRLASTVDPLGNKETITRDKLGRPVEITRIKGRVGFTYDPDGRLSGKSYNKAIATSFKYDAVGNLTGIVDSSQKTGPVYDYDAANRISKITFADKEELSITYDAAGNQSTITYPGLIVSYQYNNRNRVSHVEWSPAAQGGQIEASCDFTYDGAGNLLNEIRSNGTSTEYAYDAVNRVTEITHSKGTGAGAQTIAHMKYTRDAVGNITEEESVSP